MARLPRLTLPDYPHHVIQRGNNRQPVFLSRGDREFFLSLLGEHAAAHQVAIHAYVLMDNHFHLLATPRTAQGLPKMMQSLGRRYVRYFNDRNQRSGTLWEGRYKSTIIQSETYLLACLAYIDLNPVRAGIAASAADYGWSSHGHYVGLRPDRIVTPPALYWEMGNTPFAREAAYAAMVAAGVPASQQEALTQSTLQGWALGDAQFTDNLQKLTDRRVTKTRAGRPSSSI
ncbi:transposase [Variovorax sp. VNK109]|jgi:putative transposase|uniref:transposase n=1 Tax=Variovorax sp. VNK109 TaxID=3400919 RepID=UPI003BFD7D44